MRHACIGVYMVDKYITLQTTVILLGVVRTLANAKKKSPNGGVLEWVVRMTDDNCYRH